MPRDSEPTMLITSQEYVPFVVLLFICLSIRLGRASLRNLISVTVGALTVWVISPAHSSFGKAISFGVLGLAIAMSPFGPPLFRFMKSLLSRSFQYAPKSVQPKSLREPKPGRISRVLTNPDPINVLHDEPDAEVDIVAVHGLGSSVETTWTHESGKLWLRDFLPHDFKKSRIMTFRHNSSWKSQAQAKDLADHGRQFLDALEGRRATDKARPNTAERPLILVGHSFGGLLIEQALVLAKGPSNDPNTRARHLSLAESLAGVIFLGTPYAGSGYSFLGKIYCLFHYWDGANPMLLQYLDPGSKETVKLEDDFLKAYPGRSFDYYETTPNVIFGIQFQMVVTRDSGTRRGQEGSPLDTNHFGLNKYSSRSDASYIAVKGRMAEMLRSWTGRPKPSHID
ncbi:hypothetical protein F4825DRAFT_466221 [Nemania diffusa]|nr:hypothetical protein F4825DRAFT_466221 [Nemania diffusa]